MADKQHVEQVLTAVQTGIKTRGELRSLTGLHYSAINDALYELESTGKVEKVETVNKTYYRLAGSQEQPPSPGAPARDEPEAAPAPKQATATKKAPAKRSAKKGAAAKKGARKGAAKVGRARRKTAAATAPVPAAPSASPPPFSQNGFASAIRAAALEFEYQALWGEPSPKAETVKSMVAEAAAHLDRQ